MGPSVLKRDTDCADDEATYNVGGAVLRSGGANRIVSDSRAEGASRIILEGVAIARVAAVGVGSESAYPDRVIK